jgi:hypothetical protein
MGRTRKNVITLVLVPLLFMGMAQAARAQAYTDYIDRFSVTENGSLLFTDPFNDGNPPPSAPNLVGGTSALYHMGTPPDTMGPETNNPTGPGKLTIDSSGAIVSPNATGQLFLHQSAYLGTLLYSNDTFSVTGVFDLVVPTSLQSGYGVQLTDSTPTNPQYDLVQMNVTRNPFNQLVIQLAQQNFVSDTLTIIESTPLVTSPSYNQIALTLARGDLSSDAVTGSFYYLDSGVMVGSVTTFADTASVFSNEDFTQAGFAAYAAVPEPSAMLFLVPGLVALVGVRRRLKK